MSMYDIRNESPDAIDVYIYSDVENAWWGGEDSMGADKFRQELEKNKNASQTFRPERFAAVRRIVRRASSSSET